MSKQVRSSERGARTNNQGTASSSHYEADDNITIDGDDNELAKLNDMSLFPRFG